MTSKCETIEVICYACGKRFSRIPSELKPRRNNGPLGIGREKRHYCSAACRINSLANKTSPNWTGGIDHRKEYIAIKVSPDDFFYQMADHHGYVLEHRLVMARYLKRCLLPWEIVHHKNGMKSDNRLENLELMPSQTKHLAINMLKKDNNKLRARLEKIEEEVRLLKWQIKELNRSKNESPRI